MAAIGTIEALTGGLDPDTKKVFRQIFEYVLKDYRVGRPSHQAPAENLRMAFVEGMTHAVADTEFSIEHGLERAPYVAIPVLDLQAAGAEIVPLRVTRAADARRVYLSSSATAKAFTVLVEA